MDEKGKPLTAPVYHNITVLSKDLFLCALKDIYSRIIVDRNGQVVRYED